MSVSTIAYAAVGLSIIYFVTAVLVSHASEICSYYVQMRAKMLETSILNLIAGKDRTKSSEDKTDIIDMTDLAEAVYNHGLINGLLPYDSKPAYIPAANFTMAFVHRMQEAAQKITSKVNPDTIPSLQDQINLLPDDCAIKSTLLALNQKAQNSLETFRTLLETHFDNVMDRVSGKYKQWSKLISVGFAFAIVISFNIDSIAIFRAIDTDVHLQSAIGNAATVLNVPACSSTSTDTTCKLPVNTQTAASHETTERDVTLPQIIAKTMTPLLNAHLPVGWVTPSKGETCAVNVTPFIVVVRVDDGKQTAAEYKAKCMSAFWSKEGIYKVFGWIITVAAASLGAPFWFLFFEETVRLTGMKPKTSDAKSAERQA